MCFFYTVLSQLVLNRNFRNFGSAMHDDLCCFYWMWFEALVSGWAESKQWLQKAKRLCWHMENRESIPVQSKYYYQALASATETSLYWTLQEHWGHAGKNNTTSTLLFFLSFIKKKKWSGHCVQAKLHQKTLI